ERRPEAQDGCRAGERDGNVGRLKSRCGQQDGPSLPEGPRPVALSKKFQKSGARMATGSLTVRRLPRPESRNLPPVIFRITMRAASAAEVNPNEIREGLSELPCATDLKPILSGLLLGPIGSD